MPRRARVTLPNVPLHIIRRGNNRNACFFADEDYQFYLQWLHDHAVKLECHIHAWVLMTNHVHLLVSSSAPDAVGALMKAQGQRYVQYVNRTYRRSGTLWEGRFRPGRKLFTCLSALHRTKPGSRRYGAASGGLSLVKLPLQRARGKQHPNHATPLVSGLGCGCRQPQPCVS
jgi:REP element-mobilizing transposase RayT